MGERCVNCGKRIEKRPAVLGGRWWHPDTRTAQCELTAKPAAGGRPEGNEDRP